MNFETYLRAVLDCNLTEVKDEIKENIIKKILEYKEMNEIRWTDKLYLDSQGNIRSSDGCPTDQMTQDLINKVETNIGCARPTKKGDKQ